jgi:superfamily II DNA or RNA helicase
MYLTMDLAKDLPGLVSSGEIDLDRLVVVEASPQYPGELVFQPTRPNRNLFYSRYQSWISCYLVLSELFNLEAFHAQLVEDGYQVIFGTSCDQILDDCRRWREPLKIEGYDLYPFQQFSLQRAFGTTFWFFNWATGAGKSFVCAAACKELFSRGAIDVVISCTLATSKTNQARFYEQAGLDVVVNDGSKPKRSKVYAEGHQVYVMNYEKMHFDFEALKKLCAGKRVVFIFDETHKILSSEINQFTGAPKYNNARKGFEKLLRITAEGTKVWPMSASVVNGNPLRFRDVFSLDRGANPLGGRDQFASHYANEIKHITLTVPNTKKTFEIVQYDWNLTKLQEIRHRVGDKTQTARKTDPGIAHLFKELQTLVEPIQMDSTEREITDAIVDEAFESWSKGESLKPYYDLLRYTCNTVQALGVTNHAFGKELAQRFEVSIAKHTPTKLTRLNEMLETARDAGDQVVVFTHWTNLTLHLVKDHITVPHVVHYGTGQSDKESQRAQDTFKSNPDITCFLSSDAGSHGLNLQNARLVIQLEPTYSYDDGMQRASRIHRADSYLDGLTNFVMVTDDSVEQRVWQINNARRVISEAVQGTTESLNVAGDWELRERAQRSETDNLAWMLFGDRD